MNTPVYDFIAKYASSGVIRCHMPGHKGKTVPEGISALSFYDITEINGADSLFEASGIIAESERNMSELYGSAATVYSAAGSTLCIQAMLAIMKQEGRRVFAVRNVHRAFLNAAALIDIEVSWIMPEYCGGILSGEINIDALRRTLGEYDGKFCLYVTSPDYTGKVADIAALSEICKALGGRLIVDNAHGAHLKFLETDIHPITLGADLCCDSAHKMLPAVTGAAMLHSSRKEYDAARLKQAMSLFASTSPSYLIMASLDLCVKYLHESGRRDMAENTALIRKFREHFSGRLSFAESEPFHVTIKALESGIDGNELAQCLRENYCECEYSDRDIVILMMSPVFSSDDYWAVAAALDEALGRVKRVESEKSELRLPLPQRAMSIREAVFSPCEEICVEDAEGRICGAVNVPCPPAVPIAASGEIISRECINIFKNYGIRSVNVVK